MPLSIDVSYRPDLHLLTGWWYHDSPLLELQQQYAAVAQAHTQHPTHRLLLDIRRRDSTQPAAATQWFLEQWLPAVVAQAAPATLAIAYLISPQRGGARPAPAAGPEPAPGMYTTAFSHGDGYHLALFLDEGTAMRWLMTQ